MSRNEVILLNDWHTLGISVARHVLVGDKTYLVHIPYGSFPFENEMDNAILETITGVLLYTTVSEGKIEFGFHDLVDEWKWDKQKFFIVDVTNGLNS